MNSEAFDNQKLEEYAARARDAWGETAEYREYAATHQNRTPAEKKEAGEKLMVILAGFGKMQDLPASDPAVQAQVKLLQAHITAHYYTCSDEMLARLGTLYAAGGKFTENINAAGGPGTAEYAAAAIAAYCGAEKFF